MHMRTQVCNAYMDLGNTSSAGPFLGLELPWSCSGAGHHAHAHPSIPF